MHDLRLNLNSGGQEIKGNSLNSRIMSENSHEKYQYASPPSVSPQKFNKFKVHTLSTKNGVFSSGISGSNFITSK